MIGLTGTKIGRYELKQVLAEYPADTIYLAHDVELDRSVSFKILKPKYRVLGRQSLRREARILAQLAHVGIVSVFDVGEFKDCTYMVTEFVDSGSLEDVMSSERIPTKSFIELLIQVADAVHFAHRRGFVHRNLTPRSILLDSEFRPRLVSFGLALAEEDDNAKGIGRFAGTPLYAAPEQVAADLKLIGPRTDIWTLGVVMYQALAGKRPFSEKSNLKSLFREITDVEPEPLRSNCPTVPEELERICLKCLSKNPADRYATAAVLADDLRQWVAGESQTGQSTSHQVFVSHSHNDRDFVERELIGFLQRHGFDTWYSKADIPSGAHWERTILKGLESSDSFIVVMSEQAAESEWVKDEVHWAIDYRPNRIFPILIDDCDPRDFHIRMARIEHVDFREDAGTARLALLESLRG